MSLKVHKLATAGFNLQAAAYESARPGYPASVVNFCVDVLHALRGRQPGTSSTQASSTGHAPQGVFRVLDLAAGTGKFTRQLAVEPSLQVTAAEPSAGMRQEFARVLPAVPLVDAAAASLPFESGSFDAIFCAQAFHWFSNEEAVREIHRVLAPNGPCFLIWNTEDRREPWVRALRDVYEGYDVRIPQYRIGAWRGVFRLPQVQELFVDLPAAAAVAAPATGAASADAGGVEPRQQQPWWFTSDDPARLHQLSPCPSYQYGSESSVLATRYFTGGGTWVTRDSVWQRVISKSYIATLPEQEIRQLKPQVEAALDAHAHVFAPPPQAAAAEPAAAGAAAAGTEAVAFLPVSTEVSWCVKRA